MSADVITSSHVPMACMAPGTFNGLADSAVFNAES